MRRVCFFTTLIFVVGCHSDARQSEPETDSPSTDSAPTAVQTMQATEQPFQYRIEGSGTLQAAQRAEITFQASGRLRTLSVRNGQWVKAGKLLAQLDNREAQLALQKAQTELKERQVEYESQLVGFERARQDSSYAAIQENVRYGSGLAAAQVALQEAQLQLQQTRITTPITGIVANLSVEQYQAVAVDKILCTVYNPASLVLKMQVLEGDVGQLAVGQPAEVRPVALPSQTYEAEVAEINPAIDENSMVQVKLKLLQNEKLLPGMKATATIRVPTDSSLVVPKEAVVIRSGKAVVFTEEDGLAKWNYVTTGLDNGESVQIVEGLEPNKSVIVDNNLQLAHDAPVQVARSKNTAE